MKRRQENPGYTGNEEFNYFLSVLFPDEELMILPYNRVVKDLNGYTQEEFLNKIKEKFDIAESDKQVSPDKKGTFGMYLGGKWYKLQHIKILCQTIRLMDLMCGFAGQSACTCTWNR